jgi:hypothetical protein
MYVGNRFWRWPRDHDARYVDKVISKDDGKAWDAVRERFLTKQERRKICVKRCRSLPGFCAAVWDKEDGRYLTWREVRRMTEVQVREKQSVVPYKSSSWGDDDE